MQQLRALEWCMSSALNRQRALHWLTECYKFHVVAQVPWDGISPTLFSGVRAGSTLAGVGATAAFGSTRVEGTGTWAPVAGSVTVAWTAGGGGGECSVPCVVCVAEESAAFVTVRGTPVKLGRFDRLCRHTGSSVDCTG